MLVRMPTQKTASPLAPPETRGTISNTVPPKGFGEKAMDLAQPALLRIEIGRQEQPQHTTQFQRQEQAKGESTKSREQRRRQNQRLVNSQRRSQTGHLRAFCRLLAGATVEDLRFLYSYQSLLDRLYIYDPSSNELLPADYSIPWPVVWLLTRFSPKYRKPQGEPRRLSGARDRTVLARMF